MSSAPEKLARVKDGWLQLAFLILRKDERELALLATIDLGPQDYFDRIAQLIKKREKRGFAIVYEEPQDTTLGVNQGEEGSDESQQLKQTAMAGLQQHGFAYLGDVVRPEDYWTNVPVDDGDSNAEATAVARAELAPTLRAIIADPDALVQALGAFPLRKELYDLFPPRQPDIAKQRSARAAAAILEQAESYHVFALIGLDRMAGVIDAVAVEGYQIVQVPWMDVMRLRRADDGKGAPPQNE
jgi:hypothetical protein